MTRFDTFKDAAAAARKTAMDRQQTIYVFRVEGDNWEISTQPRDTRDPSITGQDRDLTFVPPIIENSAEGRWDAPPL